MRFDDGRPSRSPVVVSKLAQFALSGLAALVLLDVPEGPRPRLEVETLLFRAAQEAVRNVVAHADARRMEVEVERLDGHVRLRVADDGRGIDAERVSVKRGEGHFGLSLLADLAHEGGGTLEVRPREGGGTEVVIEVPSR